MPRSGLEHRFGFPPRMPAQRTAPSRRASHDSAPIVCDRQRSSARLGLGALLIRGARHGARPALFAADLVVGGNGALKNREGELRDIRPTAGLTMHYFRTKDGQIRCSVGACTVVGVAELEFAFNSSVDATRRRYSATWIRGGQLGWQMVSLHISQALGP